MSLEDCAGCRRKHREIKGLRKYYDELYVKYRNERLLLAKFGCSMVYMTPDEAQEVKALRDRILAASGYPTIKKGK